MPFSYTMPDKNMPSNFEGSDGYVRYYAECCIDKVWAFDHDIVKPFTMISIYDLNKVPDAKVKILLKICNRSNLKLTSI